MRANPVPIHCAHCKLLIERWIPPKIRDSGAPIYCNRGCFTEHRKESGQYHDPNLRRTKWGGTEILATKAALPKVICGVCGNSQGEAGTLCPKCNLANLKPVKREETVDKGGDAQ